MASIGGAGGMLKNEKPILSGYLLKPGLMSGIAGWSNRYVTLYLDRIMYYENHTSKSVKGSSVFTAEFFVQDYPKAPKGKFGFLITDFYTRYYFAANSKEEKSFWMLAVAKIIRRLLEESEYYSQNIGRPDGIPAQEIAHRVAHDKRIKREQMEAESLRVMQELARIQEYEDFQNNLKKEAEKKLALSKGKHDQELLLNQELDKVKKSLQELENQKKRISIMSVASRARVTSDATEIAKTKEEDEEFERIMSIASRTFSIASEQGVPKDLQFTEDEQLAAQAAIQAEQEAQAEKERLLLLQKQQEEEEEEKEKLRQAAEALAIKEKEEREAAAAAALEKSKKEAQEKAAAANALLEKKKSDIIPTSKTETIKTSAPMSSAKEFFEKKVKDHQHAQAGNVFSGSYQGGEKPNIEKDQYGKPIAGSKTEERGKAAAEWVEKEIEKLISVIKEMGTHDPETGGVTVKFGPLFYKYQDISDTLVGIMMRAKKRKRIIYPGDLLFQGQDDQVKITLIG